VFEITGVTMFRRIVVGAAIALACGASAAWAASAGVYSGTTSQSQGSIVLTVKGAAVTRVKFVAGNGVGKGCSEAAAVQPQYPVKFNAQMKIKDGRFSGKASPRSEEVFKIAGKLTGKTISGWFTDSIPIGQDTGKGYTCSSGTVKFTATLGS
jgi:hypothetical protein